MHPTQKYYQGKKVPSKKREHPSQELMIKLGIKATKKIKKYNKEKA